MSFVSFCSDQSCLSASVAAMLPASMSRPTSGFFFVLVSMGLGARGPENTIGVAGGLLERHERLRTVPGEGSLAAEEAAHVPIDDLRTPPQPHHAAQSEER